MFKLKINFNMEKILSITRKLGISFYALLSAAASSKVIQSTKVVLIKFFALGVVKRICLVGKYIGIGIFFTAVIPTGIILFLISLGWCFVFCGILLAIELVLLPIFFVVWIATGKFFFWKMITFIHDETILLYWLRKI